MNRVNPLHIMVLLVVVILFLFFEIAQTKSAIKSSREQLHQSREITAELLEYKRLYSDKKHNKMALQKIVTQSSFKKAGIEFSSSAKALKLSAKGISLDILNSLMTKILNGPYRIKSLDIKRSDENHADLRMEIVW